MSTKSSTEARKRVRRQGAQGTVATSNKTVQSGLVVGEDEATRKFTESIHDVANPAYVSVTGGVTKSMGDYSSVKCSVTITLPCRSTRDEIDKTYDRATKLVDDYMAEEIEAAQQRL